MIRTIEYPADDTLVELVSSLGSVSAAAIRLGIRPGTLQRWVAGHAELAARVTEARRRVPVTADVISSSEDEVSREEMLEQENKELRRALTSARSEDIKFERVISSIERHLPTTLPQYKRGPVEVKRSRKHGHTLVLLWSDQHAAETVALEETSGLNEYSWDIMMERHESLRRGIASWAEVFAPIDELVLLHLGDGLSGNIHEELAETNSMPLAEATVQWGVDAAAWIASLPEVIPWKNSARVRLAAVPGNHPRSKKKPQMKRKYDNADWLAAHVMKQALSRADWIDFEIPRAAKHLLSVYDKRILMMHGDAVPSSAMIGVPWGGVIRLETKLRNQYGRRGLSFDHLAMGHWHEANVIGDRRIWVNGSVKGVDEYGLERHGGGADPTQLLVPFHPKRGMVGAQYIDLS